MRKSAYVAQSQDIPSADALAGKAADMPRCNGRHAKTMPNDAHNHYVSEAVDIG